MKSSIRRYCNEGRDVVSAIDMRVALSERPVQGTTASVYAMNETQKTLEVHKIEGFSKYHNFKLEVEGIRAWRAYGVGLGRFIPSLPRAYSTLRNETKRYFAKWYFAKRYFAKRLQHNVQHNASSHLI